MLNLCSISVPFLFSFHPKLKFYKLWKPLCYGILVTMLIFIPWDITFTKYSIWGFNNSYFLNLKIFELPLEEWLFFICIPYACVFMHYSLLHYFPKMKLSQKKTKILSYILIILFSAIVIFNYNKWYTLINFSLAIILILYTVNKRIKLLTEFYVTFLVMLIPFFIVNGILTGSFIKDEVVWYNNSENLNFRIFTIPIEDSVYAFSMVLITLLVIKTYENKSFKAF